MLISKAVCLKPLEINPLEKKTKEKVQIEIVTDYIRLACSYSHWIAKLTTPLREKQGSCSNWFSNIGPIPKLSSDRQ